MKARLEAVIYAAEEPVTLQQLATLFAEEAFSWKAEREAEVVADRSADAPDAVELADSARETGAELSDLLLTPESDQTSLSASEAEPEAVLEAPPMPSAEENTEDPALEAKRAERKREREVREILRQVLDELTADYAQDSRGIEIREIAGGFRMGTKPEMHDSVRAFVKSLKPPMKLSLPALETLAVIAYKQPVTAPEVGEIRGVDSAGVLGSLMSRKLISTAGRKQVIGRPMLYKTTKEFLVRFGLKDLSELPSMEEFEKMAAIEMSEDGSEEEVAAAAPVERSGELFSESGTEPALDASESVSDEHAATIEEAPAQITVEATEDPVTTPSNDAELTKIHAEDRPETESNQEAMKVEVEL